jgi:hypothetical protein
LPEEDSEVNLMATELEDLLADVPVEPEQIDVGQVMLEVSSDEDDIGNFELQAWV